MFLNIGLDRVPELPVRPARATAAALAGAPTRARTAGRGRVFLVAGPRGGTRGVAVGEKAVRLRVCPEEEGRGARGGEDARGQGSVGPAPPVGRDERPGVNKQ